MGDAKTRIGMKLQAGGASVKYLEQELGRAHEATRATTAAARCSYTDIGLDVRGRREARADLWKIGSRAAKVTIENKILARSTSTWSSKMARKAPDLPNRGGEEDPIVPFLNQDHFTYCDAKLIAGMWKKSVEEGKAYIGTKLQAHALGCRSKQLVGKGAPTREAIRSNRCTLADTEFGYDDAVKLAKLWKTDVPHAKAMIERKINEGHTALVRQQLQAEVIGVRRADVDRLDDRRRHRAARAARLVAPRALAEAYAGGGRLGRAVLPDPQSETSPCRACPCSRT